jgi:hypothetical protein
MSSSSKRQSTMSSKKFPDIHDFDDDELDTTLSQTVHLNGSSSALNGTSNGNGSHSNSNVSLSTCGSSSQKESPLS